MSRSIEIRIDPGAGFCFGVVNAIETATRLLRQGEVFCLGEMVHNGEEIRRLESLGMKTISHEDLGRMKGRTVLIRAHGEPPSTYDVARDAGALLVDATCPVVLGLQQKVRKAWEEGRLAGIQIVIYGKPGHAEVTGLNGQIDNQAIVISTPVATASIDPARPVALFSQTTMDPEGFRQLELQIREKLEPFRQPVKVYSTICRQVSGRAEGLIAFARSVDVLLFVSGQNSSNGKALFAIAREANARSYFVSSPQDVQKDWLEGCAVAGVSGATSTPRWLLHTVAEQVKECTESGNA